ncbi:hypothetical protein HBH56_015540 [Parastagonospora nodorum]|uniref:Uncharacterized protein n=1 Tax=Phaeosphaeria nodorum (strain SN15 / ATCC MYA-4574 / FGSC 10173) TaxID=321614 RepID=A0A7U2F003_PHANO|nr:hypothetical protein HBH56_015540 [Parastagonospora nodorum]QRC95028.1 hypothetical protein JI435_027610 [Parastagonospora nodorum SN15]KAH3937029.1 hypothetical protein HBH54_018900 [Parastagonospora nodorum]KAH3969356.1 hypothetical protein HBH51_123470 [Parastagonospora nodorum]KAH4100567.1 hypothetical protein HBH46_151350 [Parastagonospora nodorum]
MQRLPMSCIVASSPDTMSRIDMPLVSNERTPTAFTGPQTPQGLSSTNIAPRKHGGIQLLRRTLMQGAAVAVIDFGSAIQAGLECNAADLHYLDWTDEDSRNAVKFR